MDSSYVGSSVVLAGNENSIRHRRGSLAGLAVIGNRQQKILTEVSHFLSELVSIDSFWGEWPIWQG